MESEPRLLQKTLKTGVRLVFIYVIIALLGSALLGQLLPFLPSEAASILGALLGTAIVWKLGDPEKGTLFQSQHRMTGTGFVVLLGAFMLAKLLSLVPSAILLNLSVAESSTEALQSFASPNGSMLLSFLNMGICTAFCEEIVFRGCIGNRFRKYGVWFGMMMSTLLFSLYHGNLFQLVSTFLPGIVLFYTAMNYSIKWSMLLHFFNNAILSLGFLALKDAFPEVLLTQYGEYLLEAVLVIAALALLKKDHAVQKVKDFLRAPENEPGVYKAAMGNLWFVLLILLNLVLTGMTLLMLRGDIPLDPDLGAGM